MSNVNTATIAAVEDELTVAQIDRQDMVDNAIHNLINELIPDSYRIRDTSPSIDECRLEEVEIDWDIEVISEVRELVQGIIARKLEVPAEQSERFEMAFYPYIDLSEEDQMADDNEDAKGDND